MRTSQSRGIALALTALMTLSACGSTLPRDGAAGEVLTDGSVLSDPNVPQSGLGLDAPIAAGRASAGAAGSRTIASSTSARGGENRPGAASIDRSKPVKIGVVGFDVRALYAVFGSDPNQGDLFAPVRRLFDYINKHGGIGGRQIEGKYETVDVAEDQNAAAQRVCESFTTDDRMELVFGYAHEVFLSCVEQHGIPVFDNNSQTADRTSLDHPNLFQPLALPIDRSMKAQLEFGIDEGFIKRGATLGVLYEDCPWGRRIYDGVVKKIADRYGIKRVPATVKCVENLVSDLGPFTNQVQQAALKFNSEGATHVLMLTFAEGFAIGQFQQAAVQQQYHPKYFFSTAGFPYNNTHPDSAVQWQHSELGNMLGIGNLPYIDVGFAAKPANEAQAASQARCRQIDPETMTQGATDEHDKAQRTSIWFAMCDTFLLVKALGDATGSRLDVASLTADYRRVLEPYPSAALAGGRFRLLNERPEGTGFMQPIKFNGGKRPPVYFGSLRPLT